MYSIEEIKILVLFSFGLILLFGGGGFRLILEQSMRQSYDENDLAVGRLSAWVICLPPMAGGLYLIISAAILT